MRLKTIVLLVCIAFLWACQNQKSNKVLVPKQANNYLEIYQAKGDYFFGPDTKRLKEGQWYE